MTVSRLPAALALVLAFAVPAQAQEQTTAPVQTGVWSITPFLSLTFGGDSDTASLGAGGAISYSFTDVLALEGELGYVFDLAGDDDSADWSVLGVSLSALYHFPLANGSMPYVAGGVGFGRATLKLDDSSTSSTEVGFNLGGGIKTPLTDRISVRGDIRYFKYNDAAPDGFRLYGGVTWALVR